jgi:hypothetical protein
MEYNEHLLQLTTNDMEYDAYQEAILQAGALMPHITSVNAMDGFK